MRPVSSDWSHLCGGFSRNIDGVLIGILAFTFVRVKLLPKIFFTALELRAAVIADAEKRRHPHEAKLSLADHFL